MRAAKVQASLRIRAVSPEPSLLAHTSSESRGTFRQKARSLAPLNGWACAVKVCHDGMLEDTNSLGAAHFKDFFQCDTALLFFFRDTTFAHGVVGKAIKGTICTFQYSGGVNLVSSCRKLCIKDHEGNCLYLPVLRVFLVSSNLSSHSRLTRVYLFISSLEPKAHKVSL